MPNKGRHNPSSLYFSNEDYDTIIDIVETWINKDWEQLISFDTKQRDTLLDLFQNGSHKKKLFDLWVELLQIKNYQNEYNTKDSFVDERIKIVKQQLEDIFSDEIIQREMNWTTSRELSVKKYFNIEFAKGRFSFQTLPSILLDDLPWFSKSLTNNNTVWIIPNHIVNNILFSGKDEGIFLEDYICKVNLAYQDLQSDIDVFTRFTTSTWLHGIPSIINWREFYLATALYQNLYSRIKEYQSQLEWSHDEWLKSSYDNADINHNIKWMIHSSEDEYMLDADEIPDIVNIRQESFLDWLILQIKQAYLIWDEEMIVEFNKTLERMSKEVRWKKLVNHLRNLCKMYTKLKFYIDTIKRNYGENQYYSIVDIGWWYQETRKEDNASMHDELWFFRHKKFVDRREFWNNISRKALKLQQLENNFYNYLSSLDINHE